MLRPHSDGSRIALPTTTTAARRRPLRSGAEGSKTSERARREGRARAYILLGAVAQAARRGKRVSPAFCTSGMGFPSSSKIGIEP